jgi:hypothetical protein
MFFKKTEKFNQLILTKSLNRAGIITPHGGF